MTYKHGLSMYHDDLLESLPLPVLHCVDMDRRGPPIHILSVDIATELEATFVMPRVDST